MHLGGYKAEKVADIIEHMNIKENQIKTISVVACEVGSDETFRSTLLKELHARSIKTKLHLRSSLLQVTHTGQKITAEINPDGLIWKHNDDSKKVVLKLDRNGEVVTQIQPGNRAEAMFTTERNILGNNFIDSWPEKPKRFVSEGFRGKHTDDLEALAWAFFQHQKGDQINHPEFQNNEWYIVYDLPRKWDPIKQNYIKEVSRGWLTSEEDIKNILNQCYELKSGEDILNVITKYARIGEKDYTYLMLNDWIFKVSPDFLYVYLVGKKLNRAKTTRIYEIKNAIREQFNKHSYKHIQSGINKCQASGHYADYVKESLQGTYKKDNVESALNLNQEAWLSTMFLATTISESARNFRSFPITLMALDLAHSQNTNTAELGLDFLLNNHPMTRGGTWINTRFRGFHGSSKAGGIKTDNLKELIIKEDKVVNEWFSSYNRDAIRPDMIKQILSLVYGENRLNTDKTIIDNFKKSYTNFKTKIENQPSTSRTLGGSHDGLPTLQNVHAAAEVESSLKFSSYYSRSSAILAEHVHSELQKTFGEKVQKLHVKPDSVTIRDGEFQCELVFDTNLAEVKKWKFPLPEESKILMEKLKTNVKEVSEMTTIHTTSVHLEEAGKLLGVTGLLLSAQGAVKAFEHGDIKTGVVATLQTIHGVTGMTLAALGQQVTVVAENKAMKAISTGLKNPAFKRTMGIVMPVTGIAFSFYNIAEDLKRGGAQGMIDLTLDTLMVDLDIVEFVQPELAPIIIPVNLVLGAIRMTINNIYLDIKDKLKILPSNAIVLDKIGEVKVGFEEAVFHTMLDTEIFFYIIPYHEIENGHRLIEEISDYHEYFSKIVQAGRKSIHFAGGTNSWNGGGITFCLSNDSYSEMCMNYFVSAEIISKKFWDIDTTNTNDIVLSIEESHKLTYTHVKMYKSWYFFAVQKSNDSHQMEIMLSYYYKLYGKEGSDTFYLGPQRSYVEGQSGKDIYIIPKDGGSTIINNYDPFKATDLLILSINYYQILVTKIKNHVILQYNNNHYVQILEWFTGEEYRHMNLMSAEGVMFDISKVVFSSVKLVAKGVNMMSKPEGQTVDTNEYLLLTVTNIVGSPYDDRLIGNSQKNLIDGGGGQDFLMGGEGEDVYVVKKVKDSKVLIENYSRNKEIDILIIEANLHEIKTYVYGNSLILIPFNDDRTVELRNWFHSEEQRHLLVVTNDLFTFSLSEDKTLCSHSNPIHSKCIQSQIINYSESTRPLVIDLETDAYLNITELHSSNLNYNIKGNAQGNTFYPRSGSDFLQGRGGQDLYIVTPGHRVKIIDNFSPDMALDTLFFNINYSLIAVEFFDTNLLFLVNGNKEVWLNNWFNSKMSQHLQVQTADGIIFSFQSSKCTENIKLPKSVDYRKSTRPEDVNE
ncbi:uncharacterized protein LOC124401775 isoform X2 [Silurus meridionalis]|uniref:uncharacterized protein LOC124401775 isoform X2 n=1 Tax=Silurus meridionalis TaxID=175797 RepID=UPI001EE9CE0B|nr:uncharacterized protein LOC124401775 isoform X2 [Silurus meridionalis]